MAWVNLLEAVYPVGSVYFPVNSCLLSATSGYAYTLRTSSTDPDGTSIAFMPFDELTGEGAGLYTCSLFPFIIENAWPKRGVR